MITHERAKQIAKELNDLRGGSLCGGMLVYTTEGDGGEWYSASTYGFGEGVVALDVVDARKPRWTPEQVLAAFRNEPAEDTA